MQAIAASIVNFLKSTVSAYFLKPIITSKAGQITEYLILILSVLYFGFFVAYDLESIGLQNLLSHPTHFEFYDNLLMWGIFVVMLPDLFFKYRESENWKKFLKSYWIDISFLILIPLFAWLRVLKVVQVGRQVKTLHGLSVILKVFYEGRRSLGPIILSYRLFKWIRRRQKRHEKEISEEVLNVETLSAFNQDKS